MQILNCTASFTRPADTTAYTSGDLIANSVTNTSVVPMTFQLYGVAGVKIWRVNLLNNNAYIDSIDIDASAKTFVDKSSGSGVYINTALVAQPLFFTIDRSLGAFY